MICQLITIVLLKFMFFLLVDGCCLRDDDADLDEESTKVAIVIPSEIRKSARVTRRAGDDKELCRPVGQMP